MPSLINLSKSHFRTTESIAVATDEADMPSSSAISSMRLMVSVGRQYDLVFTFFMFSPLFLHNITTLVIDSQ
jgi:hypothetical protein